MPNELLPLGSVVRLVGADALVMVMGFEPQLDDVQADYLGVPYPMGLVSGDAALAFDASAVADVVHRGSWDEEAEGGIAAVKRFRVAASDVLHQMQELIASLTPERVDELRMQYSFDAFDEDPEPDFPDEFGFDVDDEPEPDFPGEG